MEQQAPDSQGGSSPSQKGRETFDGVTVAYVSTVAVLLCVMIGGLVVGARTPPPEDTPATPSAVSAPAVPAPKPETPAQKRARLRQEHAEKVAAEKMRLRNIAAGMDYFSGQPIGVAVSEVKLKKRIYDDYGSYRYVTGNYRYVQVWVTAKNFGDSTAHVNPNDFTLSTPDGDTVSYDSQTYALGSPFDAVNLPPNGRTSGWLVFILQASREYTLHYNGFNNTADKPILAPRG